MNNFNYQFIDGVYLPKNEKHLLETIKLFPKYKDTFGYQYNKYSKFKDSFKGFNVALDIGAHVGLWSRYLCDDFSHVYAFEPIRDFTEIYKLNVHNDNYTLVNCGLSDTDEMVNFSLDNYNTGHTHVDILNKNNPKIRLVPLDMYPFASHDKIDLIKIDVEGFEFKVVKGGLNTIKQHKPVIILEQKGNDKDLYGEENKSALNYLLSLGMKQVDVISGDYLLSW